MKLFLIFVIIVLTLFISASHGFLDTEITTQKNPQSNKTTKKFVKIDLDKSDTLNEKNYPDETSDITSTQIISTTSKENGDFSSTRAADLMPTKKTKVPLDDENFSTSTPLAPSHNEHANYKNVATVKVQEHSNFATNYSVQWFFGGAFAGIVASFTVIYVYTFYKSRTESSYQNL